MSTIGEGSKHISAVDAAKQRLEKSIARASECFGLLRTRLVPVMCPRPCGEKDQEKADTVAVPLVADLDKMTRAVDQLCDRIVSAGEELEL